MAVSLKIAITQNSQSIANNTSNVTVTVTADYTGGSFNWNDPYGYLTIDGTDYEFYEGFNGSGKTSGTSTLFTKTVNVSHNSDGTKTLYCSAYYETGVSSGNITASKSKTLTTIPRKSTLSASTGYLGEQQTLTITAAASSFKHTITYVCGDASGTIATKTSETSVKWTPPLSLASQNTVGTTLTATLTLITYLGSTAVGTHSIDVMYIISSGVSPTFTVDFSDATGYKDTYGYYIQLRSKLNIKVNATAMYGAEITTYKIRANDEAFSTEEATTSELTKTGNIQVYVYIQDSRGKYTQEYFYVSVEAYSPPTVSSLTVKRCDSDGTENDQGEYVQAKFTANVTSLDAQNTASYQFAYKKSTETAYTTVKLTEFENDLYISGETYMFAADTGSSYNVQLTVTDAFGSVTKMTIASTAATIMHFNASGKGIGLGKVSETEDAIDVGWDIQMNSHRITGVCEPEKDSDAVPKSYLASYVKQVALDAIYPVGSVYIAVNHTSPATFLGGTWERLSYGFLCSAPDENATLEQTMQFAYYSMALDYDDWQNFMFVSMWKRTA